MYMGFMVLADEVHTGEPLGVEMAVEKLKRYKSPGTDQIPVEVIQAESSTMHSVRSLSLLIMFGIRRKCLKSGK
jgi:hypothetical protein